MGRFALYQDYHELYDKVVPSVVSMQEVAASQSEEFAQFREILK
jgi:hypothetical protein